MKKVSLTKSMTMALRMAEMAIAAHLTTSARMVIRPLFKEVDLIEKEIIPGETSAKEILTPLLIVKVSFDYNKKTVHMSCSCTMEPNQDNTDWKPNHVLVHNEKGTLLKVFNFNQDGQIS